MGSENVETQFDTQAVEIHNGVLTVKATIEVRYEMPNQDADLPQHLEAHIETAGQQIKRELFRESIQRADLELVLEQRFRKQEGRLYRNGSKVYTFKTIFGTVAVPRIRLRQSVNGKSLLPSADAWQTPQQVFLTQGLRDAVCDGLLNQTTFQTLESIEERAGETDLIARSSILKIVHQEGVALQQATEARATKIWEKNPAAASIFQVKVPHLSIVPDLEEITEDAPDEELEELDFPIGFAGSPTVVEAIKRDQPRQVDAGWVMVQPDEVKVKAQATTERKEIWHYTAVVMTSLKSWYFSAETSAKLWFQVGGLLALLGVHHGDLQLMVLGDGAKWIRNWFEALPIDNKAMILCWYHLAKRCKQELGSACHDKAHRLSIQGKLLTQLWTGKIQEAIDSLSALRGQMRNEDALDTLIDYLDNRRPYLPNYSKRSRAGLWIASNRVEKFNDWSVAARCKHKGMKWTAQGVAALASLEALSRNGELEAWRKTRTLPDWKLELFEETA